MKVRVSMSAVLAGLMVAGVVGMVGSGCGEKKDFPLVSSRSPGAAESMGTAAEEGDYLLFRTDKDEPVARTHLKAGTPIGFKLDARDSDNKLVGQKGLVSAVAGDLVVPLNQALVYEWRMVPGSTKANKQENDWWPRP